jgi:DNA-binding winged helix-turn-helix (wHTH) protein
VRFAEFTLDAGARQLLAGATPVRISRKAFDLLAILIDHRPNVVDKHELRTRLWGDVNVVDANLNNLVAELRAALSDDAQEPRFLRTVHRVGYAFCGEAAGGDDEAEVPGTPRQWVVWKDRTYVLTEPETLIGRDPDCDIWIDALGVSRRHARIRRGPGGARRAMLEDLGSTNGTYVRGEAVTEPQALEDGDAIRIGKVVLTYRDWSGGGSPTKKVRN